MRDPDQAPTFAEYLRARGYVADVGPRAMARRMFIECWLEPGFHRFWQVWSPLAGFVLYRLYLLFGGRRHRVGALLATFLFSGFFFHDLPLMLVLGRPVFVCSGAWLFFGLATLLSARFVRSDWPPLAHLALNLGLVASGLWFGTLAHRALLASAGA